MKTKKEFKLILLILILIITYLVVQSTYSKYLTQTDNHSSLNISRWNILLNNKEISSNTEFSQNVKVTYEENEHIANDVIVPKSKGHFDLSLESTGTDLPFSYEIKIGKPLPCAVKLNSITFDDESFSFIHDISVTITNSFQNDNFTATEFYFEFPETSIINTLCKLDNSRYGVEVSDTSFKGSPLNPTTLKPNESVTFNVILSSNNRINDFQATNIKLNDSDIDTYFENNHPDFRMTSYTLNGTTHQVNSSEVSITGEVTPPENIVDQVINNFSITVEWIDNSSNILNNFGDVTLSKNLPSASIPVTVTVKQLLSESTQD